MLEHIVGGLFTEVAEKLADGTLTRLGFQKTWESLERNLKRLSVKASDVEDEIKNAELSGKKKRKREVELWLTGVRKLESEIEVLLPRLETEGVIRKFFGGDHAMKLSERVDAFLEESRDFGDLVIDVCGIPAVPFLSGRLVGEKFEENFMNIWKFLVVDGVSSIGIHGMGGSGKTTLAKHIHNRFLKESCECVFWITVSQTFTVKNMQHEIARLVGLNLVDEHDEDKRAAKLNQVLSQRSNFVLILDDVWRNINLAKLGDPLSVQGGKLIITTRSSDVCDQIGCKRVPVNTLNESEAWDLFSVTLGEEMGALSCSNKKIAKEMAKKCSGLPLAIITMAGSMKGKTNDQEWRSASVELDKLMMSENEDDGKVFEILKYSFDQLDRGEDKHEGYTKLQHCFLYCCLYPEDHKIERPELIELFISEEMLDTKRSRRKRVDQGHVMLNKLVNVCLLETDETRQWVKMHDVIRAMALKITEGRYRSINMQKCCSKVRLDEEFWTEELEKVSSMVVPIDLSENNSSLLNIPAEWTPNYPKLSTLLLQWNKGFAVIPPDSFFRMHNLHVLNISYTIITELPDSLSNLRSLRSLHLQGCRELKCVPYLGNLKELRVLNLSDTSIPELPRGMEELTNLECLKIKVHSLELIPQNLLLNFQKLECLHLPFRVEAEVEEIERLKRLEEFHGRVKDVFDFMRLMGHHPGFEEHNRSYFVTVGPTWDLIGGDQKVSDKEVKMVRTHLTEKWGTDEILLAPDIQGLELHACTGLSSCLLDDLRRLNVNVKCLESLNLCGCKGIACMLKQEQFESEAAELKYPVDENHGAMESKRISQRAIFSSLKVLRIWGCN